MQRQLQKPTLLCPSLSNHGRETQVRDQNSEQNLMLELETGTGLPMSPTPNACVMTVATTKAKMAA